MPKNGMQKIHRDYGLWIINGSAGGMAPVNGFATCPARYFEFYSISHLVAGAGRLWLPPDCEFDVGVGDCVVITPGTVNRYGGWYDKFYCEDSIRFAGPLADALMQSGIIGNGVFPLGKVRALPPLLELLADPAVDSQLRAGVELQRLLLKLYGNKRRNSPRHSEIELLIEELKSHPEKWWTVSDMAEFCNLGCDQLRRLFLRHTGVRPKIYVDRLKLKYAASLLLGSERPIAEVAAELGYVDQYHFSRRFKAVMGLSPVMYRRTAPAIRTGTDVDIRLPEAEISEVCGMPILPTPVPLRIPMKPGFPELHPEF